MKTFRQDRLRLPALCLALLAISCTQGPFGKGKVGNSTQQSTDSAANGTTAAVESIEKIPRVETSSGEAPTQKVDLGEEASIATDVTGAYLTIPPGITPAGAAISMQSPEKIPESTINTWQLVIPLAVPTNPNIVVLYFRTSDAGEQLCGLIPLKSITFMKNSVRFNPLGAGIYQVALLRNPILESREIRILDAPIASQLQPLSSIKAPGKISDILLSDKSLFIAGENYFQLHDFDTVQKKIKSEARGRADHTAQLFRMALVENLMFFAAGASGIGHLDLSNSSAAGIEFVASKGIAYDIALSGDSKNAYLAQEKYVAPDASGSIARFDIEGDKPKYQTIGGVQKNSSVQSSNAIQIIESSAYTISDIGISSFDITENNQIKLKSSLALGGLASALSVIANRAYVVLKGSSLISLEVSGPEIIAAPNPLSVPGILDIAYLDPYLLSIRSDNNLSIIDKSNPSGLIVLNSISLLPESTPIKIRVMGKFVAIAYSNNNVVLYEFVPLIKK